MADRAETIEFPVSAPGADAAASQYAALGKSMTKSADDWKAMSGHSSKATAALGAMSAALVPLGAEFGVLGASVGRASGVITHMTSLMGGPWGIAIGVATAAVGFLAKKYSEAEKEAERLTQAHKEAADAFANAPAFGAASAAGAAAWMDETIAQQEARIEATNKRALATMALAEEAAEAEGRLGGRKGGGGFRPSPTEFGTAEDLAADQARRDAELEQAMGGMGRKGVEDEILAEAERADAAERMERERATAAELADMESAQHAARMGRIAERAEAERALKAQLSAGAEDMGRLGIRAANEAAKGAAMSRKAVVQSIGDALVARGTQAMAEGGIWSSTPFMWGSGTPLVIAGAAAIAAGVGMGAASRGMSAGGGGGGSSTGTPQLAPATPVQLSSGVGNQGPVTINVQMSSVVAPNGEDGERVTRALEEAKRQGRI